MSNRSIVELNHDYCPRMELRELLAWAIAMRSYMGGADASLLPPGATFLHYRHHSDKCPLPIPAPKAKMIGQRGYIEHVINTLLSGAAAPVGSAPLDRSSGVCAPLPLPTP